MSLALVTGAGGFIGSHVVRAALEQGLKVRALVLPGEDLRNLRGLEVETMEADVRDPAAIRRAVAGCEVVFHLASIYAVWARDPNTLLEVNVEGTRTVLEASLAEKVARVVVTTSQAVWAGLPKGSVISEEVSPNPERLLALKDVYCLSKLRKHLLVKEYCRQGLDAVCVAPSVPFGPGDLRPTPTGMILTSMLNLPVFGYLDTVINPIDVRDVALGHLLAFRRGRSGASYLLGGPDNISLAELISEVRVLTGTRVPAVRVPFALALGAAFALKAWADHLSHRAPPIAPGALRVARIGFRLDCRRARDELGLSPRPWRQSVRDALSWFARNGYLKSQRAVRALLSAHPGENGLGHALGAEPRCDSGDVRRPII